MYSITFIQAGKLHSISTPNRAAALAAYLLACKAGAVARLWLTTKDTDGPALLH